MGFVGNDQVKMRTNLCQLFEAGPRAQTLKAANRMESLRKAVLTKPHEHFVQLLPLPIHELKSESFLHFPAPLGNQARGTHHQHPVGHVSCVELSPDQARLNGLSESDLIGDQKTQLTSLQQPDDRFELIWAKDGATGAKRVNRVSQALAHLGTSQCCCESPGRIRSGPDPFEGVILQSHVIHTALEDSLSGSSHSHPIGPAPRGELA